MNHLPRVAAPPRRKAHPQLLRHLAGVLHHVAGPGHDRRALYGGGGHDLLVLACTFEVHVTPEVEQDRLVQGIGRALVQRLGRLHAVIDGLLETIHGTLSLVFHAPAALFSPAP